MVVEKSVKEIENSQIELTITVDAATLDKAYDDKIAKYSKTIEMPGFRKGHVPASVVERKFGTEIRNEATYDAMEEELKTAIDSLELEQRPLPYSTPVLQDEENLKFEKGKDVTFSVKYDVIPKFTLPAYTGLEIDVDEVEVTDADIENEIKKLQDQNALVVDKTGEASDGDIITLDYVELDENGEEKADTKRENFTFTIGSGYNYYKIDSDVIGMKKGDKKVIEKTYADSTDAPAGLEGKSVKLDVECKELKVRDIPEVDDEFAQDVKEEYKTVADLKAGIKADLEKKVEDTMKNEKAQAIINKLTGETEMTLPASMVDFELEQNWNRFVKQSGLPEEQLNMFLKMQNQTKEGIMAAWRESAVKDLKGQMILEKIKKTENFEIDNAEYEKACEEQLKSVSDDATKEYYKEMIKDDMQFAKVVPFLLEKNTFKTGKKLSYKEFSEKGIEE